MDRAFIKKYGTLFLLASGIGIIWQLPYIRETFYEPVKEGLGVTDQQMGVLSSGYAIMSFFSYFIGGILADKISARKLLTISYLATGLLGLWLSTFPSYGIAVLIFVLMGVSTIVTFWSAHVKATRALGDSSEQGRLFGLQEGLRGLMNAAVVFLMAWAYEAFGEGIIGTAWAIRTCAFAVIILGILHWFVIDDTEKSEESSSIVELFVGTFKQLESPRVWLLVAIVFFAYSLYGIFGYVNTYAIRIYGLSVEDGARLGASRYVIQAFGGIAGAIFADKIGSRLKVIAGGVVLTGVSYLLFLLLPAEARFLPIILGNFVAGLFFIYVFRSQYWAIIDDAGIPLEKTGRVAGVVACLGYVPDIFMYTMIGNWLDSNAGRAGFDMTFRYAILMAVLALVATLTLAYVIKKDKKKQEVVA